MTTAAIPARPSVRGIVTPYTTASITPEHAAIVSATSIVDTFSPFQRNVSPTRSTK